MRTGVGEQKDHFQINFKFICSKNDGLMKMPNLKIMQPEPVFLCTAIYDGRGLATAHIARKQVSNTEI